MHSVLLEMIEVVLILAFNKHCIACDSLLAVLWHLCDYYHLISIDHWFVLIKNFRLRLLICWGSLVSRLWGCIRVDMENDVWLLLFFISLLCVFSFCLLFQWLVTCLESDRLSDRWFTDVTVGSFPRSEQVIVQRRDEGRALDYRGTVAWWCGCDLIALLIDLL